jgi:hypothetical protein
MPKKKVEDDRHGHVFTNPALNGIPMAFTMGFGVEWCEECEHPVIVVVLKMDGDGGSMACGIAMPQYQEFLECLDELALEAVAMAFRRNPEAAAIVRRLVEEDFNA